MSSMLQGWIQKLPDYRNLGKQWFREWRIDLLLLLASAVCFGVFLYRSLQVDRLSGINAPMAFFSRGKAEKKPPGSPQFYELSEQSQLFNLDSIWVGKSNEATLMMEDGSSLTLAENTLLILKRPFKPQGRMTVDQQVKVLKGRVKTEEGKVIRPVQPEEAPVVPEVKKDGQTQGPIIFYPRDQATIYMRPEKNIPLTFSWSKEFDGYLILKNKNNEKTVHSRVENRKYLAASLDGPGAYLWKIVDSNQSVLLGPFSFEIKQLNENAAKEILKNGTPSGTEVYW
ncbi:MAG: hypothetical protein ACO3A2_01500 [Bdellovibrionia bacterium]